MSSENIAPKRILSPRFAVRSPNNMDEQRKNSMARVEMARKSMPVDKFSIFNQRKGKSNAEIIKDQKINNTRKDEGQRQ